jgi:hypothetical protein
VPRTATELKQEAVKPRVWAVISKDIFFRIGRAEHLKIKINSFAEHSTF